MSQDYQQTLRRFFKIYPDYPLCKSLVENLAGGVCGLDHAEQLIYNRASGAAQNREAIDEKIDAKKIEVGGAWRLLKELSPERLLQLPDEAFVQAVDFYLKNPYVHGRVARPAWFRLRFVRIRFLRCLWIEAQRRNLDEQAADLRALLFLA